MGTVAATAIDATTRAARVAGAGTILVLLLVGLASGARADELNGFLPARGSADVALSATVESYDHFWVGSARTASPDLGRVETTALSLWARYGITDDLVVILNVPYVDVGSNGLAGFSQRAFQDLSAVVGVRLAGSSRGRHSVLVAGGLRTPLSGYEANLPVSVGDGSTDVLASLVYQYEAAGLYLSQQVGYELRGGDAPDGLLLYTELGHSWGDWTLSASSSLYRAASGTDIGDPGFTFPSNREERWRAGAKLYGRLSDRFGVALSGFTTLGGRNTGEATGYSLGLVSHY